MAKSDAGLKETPSQTAGPYINIGMDPETAGLDPARIAALTSADGQAQANGQRIRITGVIHDGNDAPLQDAMVELWQADASGIYNSPHDPRYAERDPAVFGWQRTACDLKTGAFFFETIKPGPVPGPGNTMMAPHLNFWIVARGLNIGLLTRMYFPDQADANAADPVLALIDDAARQRTLIALPDGADEPDKNVTCYRFVIRLHGDDETVFFDG